MSFSVSPILSRYIGAKFLKTFLAIYGGLLGLIFLIDSLEMIRSLAKYGNLSFGLALDMTAMKLPQTGLDLMPFALLIAAVFTFWRLSRTSELVVVRATGVSAWQFLLAPVTLAFMIALVKMFLLNPVGAVMTERFEHLEARYISHEHEIVNISKSGLWLRQVLNENQVAVLHSTNIKLPEWEISPAITFFFDRVKKVQTHRIDAKRARLLDGQWQFYDAWVNPMKQDSLDNTPRFYPVLKLPTQITSNDIMSRFTSPRTIPFWSLPEHARILQSTGFEANPLWAHFYGLLAEPFLNIALVVIAAALALRAPRMQRNWWLVIGTLCVGFVIFFMGDFLEVLGISDKLPLTLAAFVPATISLFMGLTALLYLEDG